MTEKAKAEKLWTVSRQANNIYRNRKLESGKLPARSVYLIRKTDLQMELSTSKVAFF